MKKIIGITLLAAGIVLLVLGYQSKQSFGSKLSETFGGSPDNKQTWFLVGGAACAAAGAALIFVRDKK